MPTRPHLVRPVWLIAALAALTLVAVVTALMLGDTTVTLGEAARLCWQVIQGAAGDDAISRILLTIRLPRIVMALMVGAGMGLAGLASQTLFRNPLASTCTQRLSHKRGTTRSRTA